MTTVEWLDNLCVCEINLINTYIAGPKDYPMKNPHRHHHGFLYTTSGTEIYNFNGKIIRADADSVLYIPKNEQYTIDFTGEKSIVAAIDFEIHSNNSFHPFIVKPIKTSVIRSCFADAERNWLRKKPGFSSICKSSFYKIVSLLINNEIFYSNSEQYHMISDAVDYLHRHYLENNFRISTLFEISGISPRYFETLFFKEFKTTPKEYVISLKIAQAKELLKSEKYSVGEVALQLGYGDIYHFSKVFKAKTGYTPSEFKAFA